MSHATANAQAAHTALQMYLTSNGANNTVSALMSRTIASAIIGYTSAQLPSSLTIFAAAPNNLRCGGKLNGTSSNQRTELAETVSRHGLRHRSVDTA